MSHLRPEDRDSKQGKVACRKGRHQYGGAQSIGAGILRRVCDACGEVTIDLTGAHELTVPVLRHTRDIASLSNDDS